VAECSIHPTARVVSQPSRCLLEQETQTNQLWVPQQGLVFVKSHNAIWRSRFNIIYVQTWPLGITWGSDRQDTVGHCLRLKVEPRLRRAQVSLLTAFVEVWHSLILFVVADWHICDYILVINRDPQFFTFIVKAASVAFYSWVWCYIISGELVYSV